MSLTSKFLWIVNMNTETSETAFSKHALAIGATGVCIRTSSKRFPGTIKRFHDLNMKVYAWRWPSASKVGALNEAKNVAKNLIPAGLDGYIVDPESDKAGAANDWNRSKLAPLAAEFCSTIKDAAPASFVFATTSGCVYPTKGVPAWKAKSLGKPIIPMAGEVDVVRADEIAAYGVELQKMNVTEGHFYTDNGQIPVTNLAAMKAL